MKTLKILKNLIFPVLVLSFFIYLAFHLNTIKVLDMIDNMVELNEAGTLSNSEYINIKLGISFITPETEGTEWTIIPYKNQFANQPNIATIAARAEYVYNHKDEYWPKFILRARYINIPYSRYKKETSREFAQRMHDDYVRDKVSQYREEYKYTYQISESYPVKFNEYTFYMFTSYDAIANNYFTEYTIRENDFGYRFFFYGWNQEINQEYVNEIMKSVKFTKPTIVIDP